MFTYKKIIIGSSICFVSTVIFGFVAYQSILEFFVRKQVSLRKNNYVRELYLKYPIPLDFRVYFFNVTNPEEVQNGQTPIVQEVGPYCYDLYKERINVTDDEVADSLTYSPQDLYLFNPTKSKDLTPEDEVTIIHPLILGMVNFALEKSPKMLPFVAKAIEVMFPGADSMYYRGKVKDILFDGMYINCTTNDFAIGAICATFKMQVPGIIPVGKKDLKFALIGSKNGSLPDRITVSRGIRNNTELGKLLKINNRTHEGSANEECDKFRGTDGWIFPPFSGDETQIWLHPSEFCLNLHADFVEKTSRNGVSVRKFYSDFNDICQNCTNSTSCPLKGFVNLSKCVKVPLYLSLPHFLKSDPKTLYKVEGLNPEQDKHITQIFLEETLSLPIEAQIRAQFNFAVQPNQALSFMNKVPTLIHPILWMEIGIKFDGWLLSMVKGLHCGLTTIEVVKYVILICSLLGVAYGYYIYRKNRKFYTANAVISSKSK